MNESQAKIYAYMNDQIEELKHGMDCLDERRVQPTEMGNVYNGMLKSIVPFEIKRMESLRDELVNLLN